MWFSASSVSDTLADVLGFHVSRLPLLTLSVQLGFVVGAAGLAVSNLADRVPTRRLFVSSALLGACFNGVILVPGVGSLGSAAVLRFLVGASVAGVYPSGMKAVAGWYRERRGMALGVLIGALTVGSAMPHLVRGLGFDWRAVLGGASVAAVVGVLVLAILPLGLRFAARDELFDWPGLGRYLAAAGHPRVGRVPPPARRPGGQVFEEGDSLVVFPQGSVLGGEVGYQPGTARLARRLGRQILPVVLSGSHRVWEHPFSPVLRLGQRTSMRILEPVPPDQIDFESMRRIERRMKRMALHPSMATARRYEPDRDGWWDGYEFEIDPDFARLHRRVEDHRRKTPSRPDPGG